MAVREKSQEVREGMECLQTNLKGDHARLEGKLEEMHQSIAKLNSQAESSRSPAGKFNLLVTPLT